MSWKFDNFVPIAYFEVVATAKVAASQFKMRHAPNEKILKRDPRYVPALARLARIYEGASDWDRCTKTLERAKSIPTKSPHEPAWPSRASRSFERINQTRRDSSNRHVERRSVQARAQAAGCLRRASRISGMAATASRVMTWKSLT